MNYTNGKTAKKAVALTLACLMLILSLCSCGKPEGTAAIKIKGLNENESVYSERQNHVSGNDNLVYVAKSGLLELYFDSVTFTVAVKDTSTGKYWYSLPESSDADENCKASLLSLKLSRDNQIYYLNSQDNSVAFSTASFKPVSNGIQITYDMALNAETANMSFDSVKKEELYASVTVVFTLADGAFYAKISCGNMMVSEDYKVESIEFMNYFGATTSAAEDDYIFVPDASGALIKIGSAAQDEYESRNYKIYGNDLSFPNSDASADGKVNSADALVPVFGMKSGSNAYLGIILAGDTIATVTSHRFKDSGSYNRVGASFTITDTYYTGNPEDSKRTKYSGESYGGEIDICYRFLSNKNTGYIGLVTACREVLIREGVLSSETLEPSEHIPFMLTVQGAVTKNSPHSYTKLSTYEQTQDLLELLKAKSVNDITLRYKGVLKGADNQDALEEASPIKGLGSKKDFEALRQYILTQKYDMYLDMSLLSFNKKSASVSKAAAKDIKTDSIAYTRANPYSAFSGKADTTSYLTAYSRVEDSVISFLSSTRNYPFDGYCVNDAGKILYSDYSDEVHSRSNAVNILTSQLAVLSNNHKVMVDTGNFYLLRAADTVVDIPRNTAYPEAECYVQIPFIEIVLHSIVDYSLEPVNLAEDTQKAFLKSVEYGAMPSYEWFCTSVEDNEVNAKYYYSDQLTQAADNYMTADAALGTLSSARITNHYEVQPGVFCTEYNNSILLYFNYTSETATVNSISIKPMSCIRAN